MIFWHGFIIYYISYTLITHFKQKKHRICCPNRFFIVFSIMNTTLFVWKTHKKSQSISSIRPLRPRSRACWRNAAGDKVGTAWPVEQPNVTGRSSKIDPLGGLGWWRKTKGVSVQQEKWMANEAEIVSFDFFGWSHVNWKDLDMKSWISIWFKWRNASQAKNPSHHSKNQFSPACKVLQKQVLNVMIEVDAQVTSKWQVSLFSSFHSYLQHLKGSYD